MNKNIFNIGIIIDENIVLNPFTINISGTKYSINFIKINSENTECLDLIITNKNHIKPSEAQFICKYYQGTVVIISSMLIPTNDASYYEIFPFADHLKYEYCKELSEKSIKKLAEIEFVKYMIRKNKFRISKIIFNKFARHELLSQLYVISWLLIPFIIIVLYLLTKSILSNFGYSFSILCWITPYNPDCSRDMPDELKFLVILYSVFNFYFYYNYIISFYENINNNVFQSNIFNKYSHKILQFVISILFFAATLIICKALFTFVYNFKIAEENGFINIAQILDGHLLILSDDKLIYYFLFLDISMWLLVRNYLKATEINKLQFLSRRQSDIVTAAKRSFGISACWDLLIILLTFLFRDIIVDVQSRLVFQLVFLQSAYLYINMQTILSEYKFE